MSNNPKKVYVASSWSNNIQPRVVSALRECGHVVYDFRMPLSSFRWTDIDPRYEMWDSRRFREMLDHPIARKAFESDIYALNACDICVLVTPCGRSAHLELGIASGTGKKTCILITDGERPELMYKIANRLFISIAGICGFVNLS